VLEADVAVIGAGPAGIATAITLARRGVRVTVVDKAVFPRDKCCGDGLTTGALRHLDDLGLRPETVRSWQPVTDAMVRVANGKTACFSLPDDGTLHAASARRIDLDAALVDLARSSGVEVLEGRALCRAGISGDGDVVDLGFDDGTTIRAWYVIGADGMWSPLRKLVGPGDARYLGEWHALRQYFVGTGAASRHLWVWFEADLLPGYAWSFPLPDGGANVGIGIQRRDGGSTRHLKHLWDDLLTRPHIRDVLGPDAQPEGPVKAWPIPARISRTSLTALGGRALFVGDAARAPDPMTGEGIAQALETGRMAADALLDAGPRHPQAAGASYKRRIATGMGIDDRVALGVSALLRVPRLSTGWMRVADHSARTRRHFARWMFEDYPRGVFFTPQRWSRGMFTGPGAYRQTSSD
jgi:geranylgeranyl reductase family protein